jgi:ABC-type cobalamin transport system permease subunit
LAQTLGIVGNVLTNGASVWQNSVALRELNNVLVDWYAPVKWSTVLSLSKEVGWLVIKSKSNERIRSGGVSGKKCFIS